MRFLLVPGLEKWQHYKDRRPPWMKLHIEILDNYDFSYLPDKSKFHLLAIWLLATQIDNKIPWDNKWIERKIGANQSVDIDLFVEKEMLLEHPDSTLLASCTQSANAETETETETETENTIARKKKNGSRFSEWYAIYPVKKSKSKALISWDRQSLDSRADELIEILKNQVANDKQFLTGYAPHPSTYLNGQRWSDEIETHTESPGRQTANEIHKNTYREIAAAESLDSGAIRKNEITLHELMDKEHRHRKNRH
ncbi:MAG: hypothetical protein GY799_29560 [Desulfobulbaceae bacterium]|nr:hypothetical protein [Desulfobulbaceae bacterium]